MSVSYNYTVLLFFLSCRSKVMPYGGEKPIDYGSDGSSGSGEETESSSKEEILEEPMPEPHKPKTPPTPPNEVESSSDSSDKRRRDKREPFRPRGRSPAPATTARGRSPAPATTHCWEKSTAQVHGPERHLEQRPSQRRQGRGVGEV